MNNPKYKTYDDSALYNYKGEANKINEKIVNFILTADRINKSHEAFQGVIDEEKRSQRSSVLHTILMMKDVELCIGKVEMSRAFKVFAAKDLRDGKEGKVKVFIDVTNLIVLKDGYFICKKIDVLITYLFGALAYLLYIKSPIKLLNNSNITISGTECFVAMVDYILDYLRIIGYSQSKAKIWYLAALYYQVNFLDKDIDTYTKNLAARIAGLNANDTRGFDLYYNKDRDFVSIFSFINLIVTTFKLKDLTPEVFINKWMYSYGTGTQYGMELFTSFAYVLIAAYCGSYIVGQKQIERCCGKSMVNFAESILKLGNDEFDRRGYMEASEAYYHYDKKIDPATYYLRESILNRNKVPDNAKFKKEDFKSASATKERCKNLVEFYKSTHQEKKISKKLYLAAFGAMGAMGNYNERGILDAYEKGVLTAIVKAGKNYFEINDKRRLQNELQAGDIQISEMLKGEWKDQDKRKRYAKSVIELRQCYNLLK